MYVCPTSAHRGFRYGLDDTKIALLSWKPLCLAGKIWFNPSLTFHSPFFLLSSTLRFSIVALCTTNFSWFWFHEKTPWCGSTLHRAAFSDWIYVETWSATGGKDTTCRRSFCVLRFSFTGCHYWHTDCQKLTRLPDSGSFDWQYDRIYGFGGISTFYLLIYDKIAIVYEFLLKL